MAESNIITGQYVRISQTPANFGDRLLARMIDGVIIALYIIATIFAIKDLPHFFQNGWKFYVILFLFYIPVWMYSLLFEIFNNGQTPGKKILKIKVVMVDGSTPSISGYLLRWLLYPIDVPFTSGLGALFVLLTKNHQRIGDLAAGTMVIKINDYKNIKVSLDEYAHLTEGYIPSYPQVVDLSFEQIKIIESVLAMPDKKRVDYMSQLSAKLEKILNIDMKFNNKVFLETIIKDYQYYAFVDI